MKLVEAFQKIQKEPHIFTNEEIASFEFNIEDKLAAGTERECTLAMLWISLYKTLPKKNLFMIQTS